MPPTITVSRALPEHAEALHRIWRVVYQGEEPTDAPKPAREGETHFVALVDGIPAAACQVSSQAMMRGGQVVPCAAIGAVATLPEYRGLGVGSSLMLDLLNLLRSDGFVLAALYAFRESFYQKFGYAICGWRHQITCPQNRLPHTEATLAAYQVQPVDVAVLNDCYQQMISQMSGSFLRSRRDWESRLGKKPKLIYAVGDPVEGYLWSEADSFWGKMSVGEVCWSSRAGYDSIMSLMRALAHNQSNVVWNEPPESPYLTRHFDQGAEVQVYRQSMFRVLDVPAAVALAGSTGSTLQIDDLQIQENRIAVGAGPMVEMDIQSFTQAFMGSPSLGELAVQGLVKCEDSTVSDSLVKAFPRRPVVCMDFF